MYKEYKFVNALKSYEIIIDGEMIHISGKYGGSANINSIQSIKYTICIKNVIKQHRLSPYIPRLHI